MAVVQNITVPKNFTRSRYSLRRAAALLTTTTLPTNNDTISSTPLPTNSSTTTEKNVTTKKSIISTTKAPKGKITKLTGATIIGNNTIILSTPPPPTATPATTTTTTVSTITTIEPIKVEHCGEQIGEHFPWIAVIEHTKPNGKRRRKTLSKGVLIDSQHVLTTVSSIHNSLPFWIV